MKKILLIVLTFLTGSTYSQQPTSQQIENLYSFSKLYGYVRYFHPSDEAVIINWEKFLFYSVDKILKLENQNEFKGLLENLFQPIAGELIIYNNKNANLLKLPKQNKTFVAWQYRGLYSGQNNTYRNLRISNKAKYTEVAKDSIFYYNQTNAIWERFKLFEKYPEENQIYRSEIGNGLICEFPLTVYYESGRTISKNDKIKYLDLLKEINLYEISKEKYSMIENTSNLIHIWNVVNYFFAYFDEIEIDWDKEFRIATEEMIKTKTDNEFYFATMKMLAKLKDGHIWMLSSVYGRTVPFYVDTIEDKLVVIETQTDKIKRGDIITEYEGIEINQYLDSISTYIPGSPQYIRYRRNKVFGFEQKKTEVELEIERLCKSEKVKVVLDSKINTYSYKEAFEYNYQSYKKIDEKIYYINFTNFTKNNFLEKLDSLNLAKGVIIDFRDKSVNKNSNYVSTLPHLCDTLKYCPEYLRPEIILPDNKKNNFTYSIKQYFPTAKPTLKSNIVLLIDESNISAEESFLAYLYDNKNVRVIGASSSTGANGNIIRTNLLGNSSWATLQFTGMKVKKHDGSQHFIKGYESHIKVERTIQGVKEGRDEVLERAIEYIKNGK